MNPYVFSVVVLRYIPNVLGTLIYVLIYLMMERLFTHGRIQSSMQHQAQGCSRKLEKCFRIGLLVMVLIFVVTESICCLGVMLLGLGRDYFSV